MARGPEFLAREVLKQRLGVEFSDKRRGLGEWGQVDGTAVLPCARTLVLEVETKQKHPSTNVLKLWPVLEADAHFSVLFVHAFFIDSPGRMSSRGKLAAWVAGKMEKTLEPRFLYRRIVLTSSGEITEGFSELQQTLALLGYRPQRDAQPVDPPDRQQPASPPVAGR
jgi:hypothetical protein